MQTQMQLQVLNEYFRHSLFRLFLMTLLCCSLPASNLRPPCLSFPSAGITGMQHCAWLFGLHWKCGLFPWHSKCLYAAFVPTPFPVPSHADRKQSDVFISYILLTGCKIKGSLNSSYYSLNSKVSSTCSAYTSILRHTHTRP